MANSINFVGKIRKLKDGGYEEREFNGGLVKKTLKFLVVAGDTAQRLEVSALVWKDEKKNKIYTLKYNENGKDEKLEVKWTDRFNQEIVDSVSGYKKFVVDTDTKEHRDELTKSGNEEELEVSKKKRKEFLHAADFIDYLKRVLDNEKSRDMVFSISGTLDFNYSETNDKHYRTFTPQKVTRVVDDAEQMCRGSINVYFCENAVNDSAVEETGDITFNTYAQYYDANVRANAFAPFSFVINKDNTLAKGFKTLFSKASGEDVKELGIVVDFINGAQRQQITFEMLTPDQQELIELNMATLEEIAKELEDSAYGKEKKVETRLVNFMKGYKAKSVQDTAYTIYDCMKKPVKVQEEEVVDLFEDDENDSELDTEI